MRFVPLVAAGLTLMLLAACEQPAVSWQDPISADSPASATRLVVDSAGNARFVADSATTVAPPSAPGLCPSSVRMAAATAHLYAVWWSVRPDSSAILYSASSGDGGKTWGSPAAVDTSDVSSRGCSRPPPSLTTVGDDMYSAYSMSAPEGTGVFFAHTMSSMLHSPVAVIYGDRLVATAIAAEPEDYRVAVAYEEPNGKRQRIDVALSTTQGHIFEQHLEATRDIDVATSPWVALNGRELAVGWIERSDEGVARARMVRVGRIQ